MFEPPRLRRHFNRFSSLFQRLESHLRRSSYLTEIQKAHGPRRLNPTLHSPAFKPASICRMPPSVDSSRPIMAPSVSRHHSSSEDNSSTSPSTPPPLTTVPQLDSARASKRHSTISASPSTATSETASTTTGSDPRVQEIATLQRGLQRLESSRLQQQRYVPSREKSESISSLALGAKVERALGRRMTGQDAVLRPKVVAVGGEKHG